LVLQRSSHAAFSRVFAIFSVVGDMHMREDVTVDATPLRINPRLNCLHLVTCCRKMGDGESAVLSGEEARKLLHGEGAAAAAAG
jgi:hypothetical protein